MAALANKYRGRCGQIDDGGKMVIKHSSVAIKVLVDENKCCSTVFRTTTKAQ
jgi:hypothetical protein